VVEEVLRVVAALDPAEAVETLPVGLRGPVLVVGLLDAEFS
jgi:hypothetical protein